MKYKPEVKLEVIDLYRGGMPRRRISESKGIPLSTVRKLDARHRICGGDTDQMRGMW